MLEAKDFDVLFLDLHLPDCNADQVLDHFTTAHLPAVVLIAGAPESKILDQALDHSVHYALAKPLGPEDVQKVMQSISR